MRSRGWLKTAMPGSSSWMPCAPQGVKGFDDDDHHHHHEFSHPYTTTGKVIVSEFVAKKNIY